MNNCFFNCDICKGRVEARKEAEVVWTSEHEPVSFVLYQCGRCGHGLLASRWYSLETEEWSEPFQLFPAIHKQLDHTVPQAIRRYFWEAEKSFISGLYVAAALMCRRVVESVCHDMGQVGREPLHAKLRTLANSGRIDATLSQWAHQLRETGNLAAHDVNARISESEARDAIDFTFAFLDNVYGLRRRFEEFQARRA